MTKSNLIVKVGQLLQWVRKVWLIPLFSLLLTTFFVIQGCNSRSVIESSRGNKQTTTILTIDKQHYADQMAGFWLGQCIANWTGLVTEMDKIGGEGLHGQFYTRHDWGRSDLPSIWGQGISSELSETIDWVLVTGETPWGSDDDTDIEYMYQYLLAQYQTSHLSPQQIKSGWLNHIFSDTNTPFMNSEGQPENFLWVSNQRAHDLMREGILPPQTGDQTLNPHTDMIDAQLTTEIFGLLAPGRPDIAISMAKLPIMTTARGNAQWIAEFYVRMHALASIPKPTLTHQQKLQWMAHQARQYLPKASYAADMFDFVWRQYQRGAEWEETRDSVYQRYQLEQTAGYDISSRNLYCNGCFAAGINFAASLVSLFYGEGEFKKTVQLAVLMGWDSDNPAATWGGLLGFMLGAEALQQQFDEKLSRHFNIHRTRGNFANDGVDTFDNMANVALGIIDNVITNDANGTIKSQQQGHIWLIPLIQNQQ